MRSSAPEGQHAPRAKQAPPSTTGGSTAGPTGAQPTSPHPQAAIAHKVSAQSHSHRGGAAPVTSQSRVAAQSRNVALHQNLQKSLQRVNNSSVPVSAASLQHQRSPTNPPVGGASPQAIQQVNNSSGAKQALQTPNKVIQARLVHSNKTSPQALPKNLISNQRQPETLSKPGSSPQSLQGSSNPPNFGEYDDQEWDVGVGHLIIDLDADIAQADRGKMSGSSSVSSGAHPHQTTTSAPGTEDKHSLKMKIKRTKPPTKTSEAKHEIVKPDVPVLGSNSGSNGNLPSSAALTTSQHNGPIIVKSENSVGVLRTTSASRSVFKKEKRRLDVNGSASSPPPSQSSSQRIVAHPTLSSSVPSTGGPSTHSNSQPITASFNPPNSASSPQQIFSSGSGNSTFFSAGSSALPNQAISHLMASSQPAGGQNVQIKTESRTPAAGTALSNPRLQQEALINRLQKPESPQHLTQSDCLSPALKKQKLTSETSKKDVCIGTSVGTITEPDCLGPCEPGSSVTLEGIVWHETESGVLVVNVTWRGKTYVGTLLDCTKHDWAPPRFCDSPTSDLESRTPKGRAKRGRTAASSSSSSTSTTHTPTTELTVTETRSGKLRNATLKGRRGSGTHTINPPQSPVKLEIGGMKRKGREVEFAPNSDIKSSKRARASPRGTPTSSCNSPSVEQQQLEQQHQQSSGAESLNPPASPQLIECPEPNCSKKYRHINGLKYHQSHAHANSQVVNEDESSASEGRGEISEADETRPPSPTPVASVPGNVPTQDLIKPAAVLAVTVSLPTAAVTEEPVPSTPKNNQPEVNGNILQSTKTQQVCVYATTTETSSSPKLSVAVSSVVAANSVSQSAQPGNDSAAHKLPSQNPDADDSRGEQKHIPEAVSSVAQNPKSSPVIQTNNSFSQIAQTNNSLREASAQPPVTQNGSQGITQIPNHLSQSYHSQQLSSHLHAQSHPVTQTQSVPSNRTSPHILQTNGLQHSSSSSASQFHNLSETQVAPNVSPPPSSSQNISASQSPSTQVALSPSLHPGSQGQASSQGGILPQSYISSQQHSFSAYHPQVLESCPTNVPLMTGRTEVVGGLIPRTSDVSSPVRTVTSVASIVSLSATSVPQGMPLSSLPCTAPVTTKDKLGINSEKLVGKSKELVNGLPQKKEEEPSREDAHSPAYSDISDANDSVPVIDGEGDPKDFKDDKKQDIPLGASSPYAYGLYFGAYGQPPHPYLIPAIQPPPGLPLKSGEVTDLKDKQSDKKDVSPIPGATDYMKFPPQYLYSYSHLYPPGYPDPYLREPIYKDIIDKSKFDAKDNHIGDEVDRGPTDLSRNCPSSGGHGADKVPFNLKDNPTLSNSVKIEPIDARSHITPEKRMVDQSHAYRYFSGFDNRLQVGGTPIEKVSDQKLTVNTSKSLSMNTPSQSSPRLGSSALVNKDDRSDKRIEVKCEGVKPTMETTGPPPPPTSSAYYPPFPYAHVAFDPYRPPIMPSMSLPVGFPSSYIPGHSPGLGGLRYPMGVPNAPEDLSRTATGGPMLHPPSGLYTGSHKIAELQERAQKSPSGQPPLSASCTLTRGSSPLTLISKDHIGGSSLQLPPPHCLSPAISSPSFSSAVNSFSSSIAAHQGSLMASGIGVIPGDRKTPPVGARMHPPHHSLPEAYSYPLLSAQFPPHFAALGVSPANISAVGVGGPSVPPSGMGGVALPPK